MSASDPSVFERRIRLPHTDLVAGRVGLGSSFGVGPDALEAAFDLGINYFYWGSLRRPGFAHGIRRLARRHRDQILVAVQSYARWPAALMRTSVELALLRLGLDHADVLVLGWWNQRPPQSLLDAALELRESGRVRALLVSSHERSFFPEMAREEIFDLMMVRYNAAHRGAEQDVFAKLPEGARRPGVVAYTATRWATLLDAGRMPDGERVPRASDCYRFCLSHPDVDMVLSGPANLEQVREAALALEKGPLEPDELRWMQRVGDHVYRRSRTRRLVD